jgi:ABC-2 type transport system ATP-binding protein
MIYRNWADDGEKLTDEELICFTGVTKKFYNRQVLHPVSFSLRRGRSLAILGPSGSGKTTLLKLIMGFLRPSNGQALVFGEPTTILSLDLKKRMVMVNTEQHFFPDMSAWNYLHLSRNFQKIGRMNEQITALLKYMELYECRFLKIQDFSEEMKKKLALIQAILQEPEILVLDDPFSNLGAQAFDLVVNLLIKLKSEGATLIISGVLLPEADKLVEEVMVIEEGNIKTWGPKAETETPFSSPLLPAGLS